MLRSKRFPTIGIANSQIAHTDLNLKAARAHTDDAAVPAAALSQPAIIWHLLRPRMLWTRVFGQKFFSCVTPIIPPATPTACGKPTAPSTATTVMPARFPSRFTLETLAPSPLFWHRNWAKF
jgi:hypothetical protein